MSGDIKKSLVYLTENLTNLPKILTCLVQESILSEDERERISNKETTLDRNTLLWSLLDRKDWKNIKMVVIKILLKTGNGHCADEIEKNNQSINLAKPSTSKLIKIFSSKAHEQQDSSGRKSEETIRRPYHFPTKWWPSEKFLPKAFQERKLKDGTLVEYLMEQIKASKNASTVISQGTAVSGLGGVGKTTTAIWFAKKFEHLYEHILWIDCGEKSLISSFKALAIKLNINTEFDLKLLALECFSKFENIACLCVFDNAECYQGDGGIRDVLPKLLNMHCIITSRTNQWGTETGVGKIPQMHLNAFNSNDGVAFLKCNLKSTKDATDETLKELCETVGNLPLALQITVTTINTKKINLNEYIHRIKTTPAIINENFDNYEKTINLSMKISLDLIKGHDSDHAKLAYNILLIFGYITPDHVPLKLFEAIENASKYEVEEAVDLLQKYSLVTTTIQYEWRKERYGSIHRLLQQVIRHNAKANEQEILRKILSCNQFSDYDKVISYCYADAELQKEFPDLRLKFTDEPQLEKLMEELRFSEAVKLSLVIKTYSPSLTADYNYAVCLQKSGEFDKAIEVLQKIYKAMLEDFDSYYEYQWDTRDEMKSTVNRLGLSLTENDFKKMIFRFKTDHKKMIFRFKTDHKKLKLKEVCCLLLLLHLKKGNDETAMQIIALQKVLVTGNSLEAVDHFIRFLSHSSSFTHYKIDTSKDLIFLELNCLTSGKSLSLEGCSFSEKLPTDLHELNLSWVNFVTGSGDCVSCYDITDNISSNLKKLTIRDGKDKTKFIFDFSCIVHCMESITLQGPQELDFGNCKWNVNELTLVDMEIPLLAQESEMKINKLILQDVILSLTTLVNISQSVEQIELKDVKIKKDEMILSNEQFNLAVPKLNVVIYEWFHSDIGFVEWTFLVNNNLNFHAINELTLSNGYEIKEEDKMSLDFSLLPAMEKVHLRSIKVSNWEISKCTINELSLNQMDISHITKTEMKVNKLFLYDTAINSAVLSQMCRDSEIIHINGGKIIFPTKIPSETFQLRATKVTLEGVNFITKIFFLEVSRNVNVNEIIDIPNLKQLTLLHSYDSTQLTLKMNEVAQLDSLDLWNVELKHFHESQWNVNEMELTKIPIEKKLKMQISKLTFWHSKIDLFCLPINLKKICFELDCDVVCSGRLNLPELTFVAFKGEFSTTLKHFSNCKKLMTIQLTNPEFPTDWEKDIKYPIKVRTIIFHNSYPYDNSLPLREVEILLNGFRNVDTLVFHDYPFHLLKLILSNHNTQSVTLNNKYYEISFSDLTVVAELLKNQNNKGSFKRIFWVKGNPEYFELHENSTPTTTNKILFENKEGDETNGLTIEGELGVLDGWWAELRANRPNRNTDFH